MTYTEIIEGEPVEKTVQDPIPATHEEVEQAREKAYESLTDKLCLEKIRKTALGTWTEEKESEFVEKVTELSAKVVELHPYPEDLIPETAEPAEEVKEDEEKVNFAEPEVKENSEPEEVIE